MALVEQTAEFVKQLNKLIHMAKGVDISVSKEITELKSRISKIAKETENAESIATTWVSRMEELQAVNSEPVYVRKEGMLSAIVPLNIVKPTISEVEQLTEECECLEPGFGTFLEMGGYVFVDTEAALYQMDRQLSFACVEVLDHEYRSFKGFTAILAVYTPDGYLYLIDAIKLRKHIPKLRLLRCGVKKVIHCSKCVERLFSDFGVIGCYWNYDIPEKEIYVDWRIRPLSETMIGLVAEDVKETVEKIMMGMSVERHVPQHQNEYLDFVEKHCLPSNEPYINDILRFRTYLASKYDEGIQYVLPDFQIMQLLEAMPTTIEEFEQTVPRMSSALRLHVGDFLIILTKRKKKFSIEQLTMRGERGEEDSKEAASSENLGERHRAFQLKEEQEAASTDSCSIFSN